MKFLLWFMVGIDVGWLMYFLGLVLYGVYKLLLLINDEVRLWEN